MEVIVVIETGRFGQLSISESEIIKIPSGILGFPDDQEYCLVDSADDTLILWLQSIRNPLLAFPVLEPKVFNPNYVVRLSAAELRELKLESIKEASVYTILTIPEDLSQMTANLKAPLVINTKNKIAKQVVLQENDQPIKQPMFKELRAHLMSINSLKSAATKDQTVGAINVADLPKSTHVESIATL